jgi:hypothetical protein
MFIRYTHVALSGGLPGIHIQQRGLIVTARANLGTLNHLRLYIRLRQRELWSVRYDRVQVLTTCYRGPEMQYEGWKRAASTHPRPHNVCV